METSPRILTTCLTTFQTCSATVPLFTTDRFARRKLFMFSAFGMSICMAIIAGTGGTTNNERNIAAVVFIFLCDFFYPIGFLGLTFSYATETASLKVRIPISAIANATQWLSLFVVAQITPPGTANLGNRYWIIWAVLDAAGGTIVYFLFPETNGRSLEDVDYIFEQSQGFLDVVRIAKRAPFRSGIDVEICSPVNKHYFHKTRASRKGQRWRWSSKSRYPTVSSMVLRFK